jgi:NADPH:quinone reductase
MFRSGMYLDQPKLPGRLGYEAAGTVEAIGEGVTGFAIGDKVSTIPAFSMNKYSAYGEQAIVPAAATVRHPDNLSWEQAAAIWMQYLTAYGALIDVARLVPGDAVIITAASSSVGLAAIQIANAAGAISIAATRTRAKREALRGHGAQYVITTEDQDLAEEVKRITAHGLPSTRWPAKAWKRWRRQPLRAAPSFCTVRWPTRRRLSRCSRRSGRG